MIFRRWRLILLFLVAAVFFLRIAWNVSWPFSGPWPSDGIVASAFRPVGRFVGGVSEAVSGRIRRYFFLSGVEKENQDMRSELERLKITNVALEERVSELSEYRDALASYSLRTDDLLPARILSHDLFSASKTALIDKGRDQGVGVDDIVVSGEGLVGRVVTAYADTSKVLLLIDPHFAVDAVNVRSGLRVLVSGLSGTGAAAEREPFLTQVEYLENAAEMHEGDPIVTSGFGGVFPGGIPVGQVDRVNYSTKNLFDKARVLPSVDFAKLRRIYVELGPREGAP